MDKKGQSMQVLIFVFIAVLVGVILFQAIADQVAGTTDTVTVNLSETLGVVGTPLYIEEFRAITGVTIVNASNQSETLTVTTDYTVSNNALDTTGALSTQIATVNGTWNSSAVYVQGTAQPLTYIDSGGGRALAGLIVIFFALAIAVVALYPVYQGKLMSMFK